MTVKLGRENRLHFLPLSLEKFLVWLLGQQRTAFQHRLEHGEHLVGPLRRRQPDELRISSTDDNGADSALGVRT